MICGDTRADWTVEYRTGGLRWYFLTTRSARELMPLVEGFGQDVRVTVDRSSGRARRELSHVLKVFLIDRAGYVREIYSSLLPSPRKRCSTDIETLAHGRAISLIELSCNKG